MKTKLIQKITSNNFDLSGACAAFHNLFAIHHFSNENNRLEIFTIANDEGSLSVADEKKSASSDDDHQAVHLGESKSSTSSQKLYELDEVKSFCVVPLSTLFEERNLVICIMNDNSKKLIYISKFVKAGEYVVKAMENQLPSFINDSLDADCLMSSCSSGYFCYYSPSEHLLQIFKLNILNQQQLTFDKSADIDIFSKKAYSLQLTHSHVVLGQLNSIQVCDWKYQQMKLNSGDTASSMTTSKATGRIIYLPKITKTTKKKAKQGTVTEKNGLLVPKKEESDAGEGKTEQAASSIKKPTSTTGSEQETISTISKQRDEKVKSVKSLSNNSFIILSSLGNLYFLNCSKEDGDVFVKLSLPIVNDKLSKISSFDVMSNQLESLYNTSISSLLVLAFDNSESIVMTSLKSFYSLLQQFKQPQSKEPGVVDIGIDSTFNLTDAVVELCLVSNNLIIADKKEICMYQII